MPPMTSKTVKMSSGGRLVIPVEMRRELGLEEGVSVVLRLDNAALTVQTKAAGIAKAQAIVAKYVKPGVSLVDELIAERRAAAEKGD
jgi:bifunctional DNA-binding transcriptional regulator/antitoxin component of YhaV-PrlF toxin-antitoxin module